MIPKHVEDKLQGKDTESSQGKSTSGNEQIAKFEYENFNMHMGNMLEELERLANTKNKVEFEEFSKYIPIFKRYSKEELTERLRIEIDNLSKEFNHRFILTQKIEVYHKGQLLFIIPKILTELNVTDAEKHKDVIDSALGLASNPGVHELYVMEAQNKALISFKESQDTKEKLNEYKENAIEYRKYVDMFNKLKANNFENIDAVAMSQNQENEDDLDDLEMESKGLYFEDDYTYLDDENIDEVEKKSTSVLQLDFD